MASQDDPFLIAGGGIGGLAAAYALARQGFPVRVLEQAPEFKEIGAGIQLGPNIFRALEKIGLQRRGARRRPSCRPRWRCAARSRATWSPASRSTTRASSDRFEQPYAVTHRADIHAAILNACLSDNLRDAGDAAAPSRASSRTPTASPRSCNPANACGAAR